MIYRLTYKILVSYELVGVTGLEPATSRPPAVRASQLRHTPIYYDLYHDTTIWARPWGPHGHLRRPRRHIFANQFARVAPLAKHHRRFSPQPYAFANCATPRHYFIILHYPRSWISGTHMLTSNLRHDDWKSKFSLDLKRRGQAPPLFCKRWAPTWLTLKRFKVGPRTLWPQSQ